VIFVDTNVFMYAVGRDHPLKTRAREFFATSIGDSRTRLVTSAEVMQELMHAYLPVERMKTLDAALELLTRTTTEVWSMESDDVIEARALAGELPAMGARDLIHLACCRRRGVQRIKTFDRGLKAAFETAT
jgi:uncharacterized protein